MLIGRRSRFIALYNLSAVFVVSACVCRRNRGARFLPNVRAEPMLEVPWRAAYRQSSRRCWCSALVRHT